MPCFRLSLIVAAVCVCNVAGQGFPPDEAVKRMELPPGFSVRLIAAEPTIRQPVSISFDDRGRMWVLQFIQYPNPAGLKPVKQDEYLRTIWDKVPEPPPHGPTGADKLTILYDPDENGVYRKSKDFLTGLNIASGFCLGHGGVFIAQPPYLLFYPDRDGDDRPDGDPEVLLSGFGMEDTHSLANSLQWGPDGWLYGAAGSTSTSRIKNPAGKPTDPPIVFQQGIWRYHPKTRQFELFSEGGGNTYGLDFDKHGQVIAGTNWGGFAMLHHFQGAYYIKGFAKHGPLQNPHAYGYFNHVPYTNFKGGHVTCGGIVYQADAYPSELHDQYIAGNLLSNDVYWHRLTASGPTFTAAHGGDLLVSNDTWFRPVDLMLGPDGAVYVADWYDKRAAHLDPIDNWDRTNGRVYRIDYQGGRPFPSFDLRNKSSHELVELLDRPNVWWRREARRLLDERKDATVYSTLKKRIATSNGLPALESLWALYVSGGCDTAYLNSLLNHPFEHVREWAVRLVGDTQTADAATAAAWIHLAKRECSPVVRAQLACSAKRVEAETCIQVVGELLAACDDTSDTVFPLLAWWAVERTVRDNPHLAADLASRPQQYATEAYAEIVQRVARRLMAADVCGGQLLVAKLIKIWDEAGQAEVVLKGIAAALEGGPPSTVDSALKEAVSTIGSKTQRNLPLSILARLHDREALARLREQIANPKRSETDRIQAIDILRQVRDEPSKTLLLSHLLTAESDVFRTAILSGLEPFDDPAIGDAILDVYPKWSATVRKRAIQTLVSRRSWAAALFAAIDAGNIPATDVSIEQVRKAVEFLDPAISKLAEKHYGKVGPATPGEKQARISWLNIALTRGKGDVIAGKALFTQHCAKCHMLFGEGTNIGPDLTSADRKNRRFMLEHIIDPSAVIRPEYISHSASLADGRRLVGLVIESSPQSITLLDAENRKTVIPRGDLEDLQPLPTSLMPEKLLDTLTDEQVCDLFAYLASDPPVPKPPGK
jgi:putative membrane-bound dehydrogenase-like protein